jgi:hypothetical protein
MSVSEYRLGIGECRRLLAERLAEPAPSRIQLLVGPRQVGKTTLLLELTAKRGARAIYAAGDEPGAAIPGYWERIWTKAGELASSGGKRAAPVAVLLDEAHLFPDWARRLKGEWDAIRRRKLPIHIVATGSAALRLGTGSRESLAGRFERSTLTHWSAATLAEEFGLTKPEAAEQVVRTGAYPGAVPLLSDRARWSAYIRDAIVEPAIGRDVLALGAVRRPALLRQVFGAAAAAPAQIVSLQKLQGQLQDAGALETIAHYLALLEDAYLIAALPKYTHRGTRQRAAPPKLITLSNALLGVVDPRGIPAPEDDPARFGAWVENACLAFAWNAGQRVRYWREEPLEVDAVLEGGWGTWAVEVKTGAVTAHDVRGLGEFTKRYPSYRPLIICAENGLAAARRLGIDAVDWREFLVTGPMQAGRQ